MAASSPTYTHTQRHATQAHTHTEKHLSHRETQRDTQIHTILTPSVSYLMGIQRGTGLAELLDLVRILLGMMLLLMGMNES